MARVNARHFAVMGAHLQLGRDFLEEEDKPGAPRVAVLSDKLWKRGYGADPKVLGRTMVLDGAVHTIVGVLPPEFDLHNDDVFTTISHSGARERGMPTVSAWARLKKGCEHRAGAGRNRRALPRLGRAVSLSEGLGRAGVADPRVPGARRPRQRRRAFGRRRSGASHRLRQCGEPSACQGRSAAKGDGHPHGAGSGAGAPSPGWC